MATPLKALSTQGMEVTAHQQHGIGRGEDADKLLDPSQHTKWCVRAQAGGKGWFEIVLPKPSCITGYALRAANDAPDRDPAEWTVIGYTTFGEERVLHKGQRDATWPRFDYKICEIAGEHTEVAVSKLRFNIEKNAGGDLLQLCQVVLLSPEGEEWTQGMGVQYKTTFDGKPEVQKRLPAWRVNKPRRTGDDECWEQLERMFESQLVNTEGMGERYISHKAKVTSLQGFNDAESLAARCNTDDLSGAALLKYRHYFGALPPETLSSEPGDHVETVAQGFGLGFPELFAQNAPINNKAVITVEFDEPETVELIGWTFTPWDRMNCSSFAIKTWDASGKEADWGAAPLDEVQRTQRGNPREHFLATSITRLEGGIEVKRIEFTLNDAGNHAYGGQRIHFLHILTPP